MHARHLHVDHYQSPRTGTAINSATPSSPATSAFLPAALLLGAEDDAAGALAVAVALSLAPPAPVDDPPEAVAVVEVDASVVVVVVDDAVPVEVSLSDTVGSVNPPSLVAVLLGLGRMPVGVCVASAAVSAQYAWGHSVQSVGLAMKHSWLAGQTGHSGMTSGHITQLFCRGCGTVRLSVVGITESGRR